MPFPILGAVSALGGLLGGVGAFSAGKSQKKAANAQANIAKQQAGMFNQVSPFYQAALQALAGQAGIGYQGQGQPTTTQQRLPGAAGQLGFTHGVTTPGQPVFGGMGGPTSLQNNPYGRQDLGIYGQPENLLRMQQMEEALGRGTTKSMDQLGFALGRRGLGGSSFDTAGRAAILSDANKQRSNFGRQLAINAPAEQERRIGVLLNALNPGLGAGPAAGNLFGQQAAMFGNQAAQAGANVGGIAQNYALLQFLKQQQNQTQGNVGGVGYGYDPFLGAPQINYGGRF